MLGKNGEGGAASGAGLLPCAGRRLCFGLVRVRLHYCWQCQGAAGPLYLSFHACGPRGWVRAHSRRPQGRMARSRAAGEVA